VSRRATPKEKTQKNTTAYRRRHVAQLYFISLIVSLRSCAELQAIVFSADVTTVFVAALHGTTASFPE
jgi:hypothetical protein